MTASVVISRARRRARPVLAAILAFVASTCRDATSPDLVGRGGQASAAVGLAITPAIDTLYVGATGALSVSNTTGAPINKTATWVSSDSNVARVTSTGVSTAQVEARAVGSVTITASSQNKTGTAVIFVQLVPVRTVTVTPDSASLQRGDSVQLTATPKDSAGNPLTGRALSWKSADTSIASVSAAGNVIARARGATSVTATVEGIADTVPLTVRVAELRVASIATSDTVRAGDTLMVAYSVQNVWDSPNADSVIVRVGYRDSTGTVLGAVRRALPRVAAGATTLDTVSIVLTSVAGSTNYSVVAYVDCQDDATGTDVQRLTACLASPASAGTIPEGNETDNSRAADFQVRAPDLVASNLVAPDSAFTRTTVTASVVVTNTGSTTGQPFDVMMGIGFDYFGRFYAFSAAVVETPALGSGESRTVEVSFPIPADLDLTSLYEIRASADCPLQGWPPEQAWFALDQCLNGFSLSMVPESDEQNNAAGRPVGVASNVKRVQIVPDSIRLAAIGDTASVAATAYDRANAIVTGLNFIYTSLDPAVVTANGALLRAVGGGHGRVVASIDGVSDTAHVHVVQQPDSIDFSGTSTDILWALGDTAVIQATVLDIQGRPIQEAIPALTSLDPAIAAFVAPGKVVALSNGIARIVATYESVQDTLPLTVRQAANRVDASPDSVFLANPGDTTRLSAVAYDYRGNVIVGAPITWTSLDGTGVSVDSSGLVTGLTPWVKARVRATAESFWHDISFVTVGDNGVPPTPNPVPSMTALSPHDAPLGGPPPTAIVTGTNFIPISVIRIDGTDRPTQFVSSTELRAQLTDADVSTPKVVPITVFTPPPNGGISSTSGWINVNSPTPAITSLTPAFVFTGSGDTEVTIAGTGFIPQSRVFAGNSYSTTVTFVSATELRFTIPAARLATPAAISVFVENPPPVFTTGGRSNTVVFEARRSPTVLASLDPPQAVAGLPELRLRVNGTGFVSNSMVRFNGAERPTTFVSATSIEALLGASDLQLAGTFPITVVTPFAGTSNALDFAVVNGPPTITFLPSAGAHASRPGFTLTVHGTGFAQGDQLLWNGSPRVTQFISSTRITGEISAADIAVPGTVQVTVAHPMGGGTSNAVTMTIRNVAPATATSTTTRRVNARDIAWDDATGRLYLSIRNTAPADANSIIAVDPNTGTTTASVVVGNNPARLARSPDGQFLYVGLDGASAVRRVTIPTLSAGLQWSLPAGEVAGELKVLPGLPNSVAISRHMPGWSPPLMGVTVYDDGVARPQSSPGHTGGNRIEFLESASVFYGYNNADSGFDFFTMVADATGVRHLNATGGLISGFYTQITGAAGRIYGTDGSIVDAERRLKVGSLSGSSSSLLVEPATGRAYALTASGITVYDLNNFQTLGTVPVPGVVLGHPALTTTRLVRWGTDGIAFVDEDDLFVVRSPIFTP